MTAATFSTRPAGPGGCEVELLRGGVVIGRLLRDELPAALVAWAAEAPGIEVALPTVADMSLRRVPRYEPPDSVRG